MNPHSECVDRQQTVCVHFVLQAHFSMLAFTAAADALITVNLVTGRDCFRFQTAALLDSQVISDLGIMVPVDFTIIDPSCHPPGCRADVEVILVCGGYRCDLARNRLLNDWLRYRDQSGYLVGGIWNGIIAVAQAGLMV